jgi:hypothetical protein
MSEPAFPIETTNTTQLTSLTKREWFAAQALSGAFSTIRDIPRGQLRFDWMAEDCVKAADAVIAELERYK